MEDISATAIRTHFEQITLPEGPVRLGPGSVIIDVQGFLDTQFERLESASQLERRLAFQRLARFAEISNHALPKG